jgi:XTP/dITP diphosphohydrolase
VIVLIATTNPDKLREIRHVLAGLPLTLRTLDDVTGLSAPEETGETFQENARQKALHYATATGLTTIAEDSGFQIDALDGDPGVHSARYLGPDAPYAERFGDLYRRLRERGHTTSPARFVCALVLASNGRVVYETTGVVEGRVAEAPAGSGGFGYDPMFYFPAYGRTFGEVSFDEKLAVSHRGNAVRALRSFLELKTIGSRSID